MVTEDRSRGQVILIGAIALAFIILGVVVVFNGVLYTETLSSGSTSQSASTAEVTEFEVEQGVGCLLREIENDVGSQGEVKTEVNEFGELYKNTSAQSNPQVKNITAEDNIVLDLASNIIESVEVTIVYNSQEFSYEETLIIERATEGCPEDES